MGHKLYCQRNGGRGFAPLPSSDYGRGRLSKSGPDVDLPESLSDCSAGFLPNQLQRHANRGKYGSAFRNLGGLHIHRYALCADVQTGCVMRTVKHLLLFFLLASTAHAQTPIRLLCASHSSYTDSAAHLKGNKT